jgi:hypothetical protein
MITDKRGKKKEEGMSALWIDLAMETHKKFNQFSNLTDYTLPESSHIQLHFHVTHILLARLTALRCCHPEHITAMRYGALTNGSKHLFLDL